MEQQRPTITPQSIKESYALFPEITPEQGSFRTIRKGQKCACGLSIFALAQGWTTQDVLFDFEEERVDVVALVIQHMGWDTNQTWAFVRGFDLVNADESVYNYHLQYDSRTEETRMQFTLGYEAQKAVFNHEPTQQS